ncbi:hypothetical protein AB0L64_39865 [Kribbella sp. NPDC051936]|uniref:hypothetical protein n=1 Tax=Kribbella sp. NPDC051936 TaxID=3154946 RepID=UPI003437103D
MGERAGTLAWSELRRGDRVHHADYGSGTVDAAGPIWLLISWDDPNQHHDDYASELAPRLTRLPLAVRPKTMQLRQVRGSGPAAEVRG